MKILTFGGAALAATLTLLAPGAASAAMPGVTVLGVPPQPEVAAPARQVARVKLPTVIIDKDVAGRTPFQATASVSLANPIATYTIPAGYRLVVEEVNVAAAAGSSGGPIQPVVLTYPYTAAQGQVSMYLSPTQSTVVAGQFTQDFPVHQYAEALSVGIGYSGYSPYFLSALVTVSGHLITITP
jgi:hypothetical protein